MKFNVALSVAAIVGGVSAAPALLVRQSGCPVPTEASCLELCNRCTTQGSSVLANPWNNRACVAAATCYGVGNLLTSYACTLGVNPPAPSSLPALSTTMFPNPTTQQNYVDFYYGSIQAAWPSSVNVVTGYWTPIIQWVNTGSSSPYNNLNDWFHWSSTPSTVTSGPTTTTPTPTSTTPTSTPTSSPTPTPTPTGCVAPTDDTCADIVNGCVTGPAWITNPWSQKKCVAAATCFGPGNLLTYGACRTGLTPVSQASAPALSSGVWSSITGSTTSPMTPQNYVDLIYSSVSSAWPSGPDFIKNTWLAPIQAWTNTGTNIPYANFNDWSRYSNAGIPGTPTSTSTSTSTATTTTTTSQPSSTAQIPGIVTTCASGVSISYDDGPYVWNRDIVNAFADKGKTTFFVNGGNWDCIYSPARVADLRYAYEQGHTIGSHTWFHSNILEITIEQLGKELDRLELALWRILGIKPAIFRPPYGAYDQERVDYLNSRGYTVVTWDLDTTDSAGASASQSEAIIAQNVGEHSMILSHETYQSSAQVLAPWMVNHIHGTLGLDLKTIDQCLGINPYQVTGGAYQEPDDSWTCPEFYGS